MIQIKAHWHQIHIGVKKPVQFRSELYPYNIYPHHKNIYSQQFYLKSLILLSAV